MVMKAKKEKDIKKKSQKQGRLNLAWFSIAGSILVIAAYGFFNYNVIQNQNLGTYDDPEVAFKETQKALSRLSVHLNTGIESVQYIKEYDNSKNLIFK